MELADYMQDNGFYDTKQIMIDAGLDPSVAFFADFYGSAEQEPGSTELAIPDPFAAMLAEAETHNERKLAEVKAARTEQGRDLMSRPEPWSYETWTALKKLGYATVDSEDFGENGGMGWSAQLTERGRALRAAATA